MTPIIFEKTIERDTTFVMQGFYAACLIGNNYLHFGEGNPYAPMVLHHATGENVQIWEHKEAMQWFLDELLKTNQEGQSFMQSLVVDQREVLQKIRPYWEKEKLTDRVALGEYLALAERGATNVTLYYYVGQDERTPEAVKELALDIRKDDEFFARNDRFIRECVEAIGYHTDLATVVLPDEMISLPTQEELRERLAGCVLIDGRELILSSLVSFGKEHPEFEFLGLSEEKINSREVRGQVAFAGKAQGRVRILRNHQQMNAIQEGDILVSPMTTPDFMPAMKKAAAFVTDEGGIMCHAAIVAREMKKPCVIGTKFATQVLHDGDMIEVDADNGVVRILK